MATAMATARSAPIFGGRKPDEREAVVGAAKHNSSSLRMQFIIFLLAIGSLTAVAGVKFRDYVFTVSVQVDNHGVIRRVVPGTENMGNKIDELVAKKNID